MTKTKRIIVYGGTGFYGHKIVQKLVQKGQRVRVVSRNREQARAVLDEEVEIYEGDVTNPQTIVESLRDISTIVICLAAMSNKLIRKMKAIERDAVLEIMAEARRQGVSRLLYISGYEMREKLLQELKIPEFGAIKIEIESKIAESDFNWTILGASPALEIFFAMTRNGKMTVPGGGLSAIPCISDEDVGEITAQAALRDDLNGRRIKLTGPEAFTFPQAAQLISLISGRTIRHMAIPLTVIRVVSFILIPVAPFVRFLYKSLKMLNNFPADLAESVPEDHQLLRDLFDYEPVTLAMEINKRIRKKTFLNG
ncbi:MAG: NAD(P)H-binding protein [Candidatus Marinimicrobia bacterium]|nr:NAD(P)H-binding protein [Candidatus Neomarinimicrobiota bacterium]